MRKKIFIGIGVFMLLVVAILSLLFMNNNKKRPTGTSGEKAEMLAQKMSKAIDQSAWDSTHYVQWTFRGEHDYLWDRQRKAIEVKWGEHLALLNVDQVTGHVYIADSEITDSAKKEELIKKAYSYFINDAFWLNAPSMIFNPDVTRSYVGLEDGRDGLLVTYNSGGVTPGDSYLWHLDETGLPTAYQMWVSIIPVGGLEFTWEDWTRLSSGAKIAQHHVSKLLEIPITNLKDGDHYSDFNRSEDPFSRLELKKK